MPSGYVTGLINFSTGAEMDGVGVVPLRTTGTPIVAFGSGGMDVVAPALVVGVAVSVAFALVVEVVRSGDVGVVPVWDVTIAVGVLLVVGVALGVLGTLLSAGVDFETATEVDAVGLEDPSAAGFAAAE